jgi:hypothetical protein
VIKIKTLTFGGWYQRTTLHLTEVYNFLTEVKSDLNLNKNKLKILRDQLNLKSIKRVQGYLEHIEIITNSKIKIRYYEDGLYVFELDAKDIKKDSKKLKEYFENKWKPAISYIFSLGAPTPKVLSNMKDNHPIVLGTISRNPKKIKIDQKIYGKIYSETTSRHAHVFKTKDYIITIVSNKTKKDLSNLLEMQIFFREFKLQLHKYLNIHRKIWEDISDIKERKKIKGKDADKHMATLESYQKTIRLIGNRINQMGAYAKTRASLAKEMGIEKNLVSHFEYKYEDLFNSLEYIKEVWKMTSDYVDSGIDVVKSVKTKATTKGLKSIQLLLSVGAVAGIVRLMNPKYIPVFDTKVAIFLIGLFGVSYLIDWYLKYKAKNKEYKLKFKERVKDL